MKVVLLGQLPEAVRLAVWRVPSVLAFPVSYAMIIREVPPEEIPTWVPEMDVLVVGPWSTDPGTDSIWRRVLGCCRGRTVVPVPELWPADYSLEAQYRWMHLMGHLKSEPPVLGPCARDTAWWADQCRHVLTQAPRRLFLDHVRLLTVAGTSSPILCWIAEHAECQSVKELAVRYAPALPVATARRQLWQQCVDECGQPPELLLCALRLYLVAHLRDARWPLAECARALGYADVRTWSRQLKTRYGVPAHTVYHTPTPLLAKVLHDALAGVGAPPILVA